MADKKLLQVRTTFVERVGKPVISGLLDDLLAQRVLSSEEVDTVQDQYTVRADKARCLIDSVRLKGHKASKILIESLRQRDGHLAEELGLGADSGPPGMQLVSPRADVTPGPPASSQGEQWIQQCSLSEYRRICVAEGNQIYPIHLPRATRTRRALLICNIEFEYLSKRCGAEKDVEGMTKLLEGLDYKVETHFNLTSQQPPFLSTAPDLVGALCHLSPDTAAWRRPQTGSIFIQHLIEQFRNCACNSHLRELFRKVQHSFDKFPQQLPAEERTTLIKKFYLFPGH
nr:PREDICTED: caspase-1-like [Apteryx mantelli mantelli]